MSGRRYPERFMIEAVKHVTERGQAVADMVAR